MRHFKPASVLTAAEWERFWQKVDVGDCWLWTAGRNESGYGLFVADGRTQRAHRIAYATLVGHWPTHYHIDHLCRTPACVNPDHLEPVTPSENTLRGARANKSVKRKKIPRPEKRTHCPALHPYDETNTFLRRNGYRECRTCMRSRTRRWRAEQREAA